MGKEPKNCPFCEGTNITTFMVDWEAVSTDDRSNDASLSEHQCFDCEGQSFWT